MRTIALAAWIVVAASLARPAAADWQFAIWGMSAAELVVAAKGSIRDATADEIQRLRSDGDKRRLLVGAHSTGPLRFSAQFWCGEVSGLDQIELRLTNWEERGALFRMMLSIYGQPIDVLQTRDAERRIWRDTVRRNLVIYYENSTARLALVSYYPIAGTNDL